MQEAKTSLYVVTDLYAVMIGLFKGELDLSLEHDSVVLLGYLFAVLQGLGLLAAVHAVMTVRTAQGALAWAIALVFMPTLTLLPPLLPPRLTPLLLPLWKASSWSRRSTSRAVWSIWLSRAKPTDTLPKGWIYNYPQRRTGA